MANIDTKCVNAIRVLAASRLPDHARGQQIILDAALNDKEVLGRKMRVNEAQNTIKADA